MSEETSSKKVGPKNSCHSCFKPTVKVAVGMLLIIIGLAMAIKWWFSLLILLQGFISLFLIIAGALTIAIAKE